MPKMMSPLRLPWTVFAVLSYAVFTHCNTPYKDQARLETKNGHLYIISASDKNITFRTSGRGYININNDNLLHLAQVAARSSETITRFQQNWGENIQGRLDSLTSQIRGSRGLTARVLALEGSLSNETNHPESFDSDGSSQIRRRLSRLRNKVNQLNHQVSNFEEVLTRDECTSSPCKNGGTCLDLYNGFHCLCPDNWQGDACDQDVNECLTLTGTDLGCQNGATCLNKLGSYECVCPPSYFGLHCTLRNNDCSSASSTQLCGNGLCVNQVGGARAYVCICDQGWTKDPVTGSCTQDIDECQSSSHYPCSKEPLVPCVNLPGSFHCGYCPQGYSGNGFHCSDIDECLNNNGGCSVTPKVQCINTRGSRVCGHCPPGYSGDGVLCSPLSGGRCAVNNGGCSPSAHCYENGGIVTCRCSDGYVGSGYGPDGCSASSLAIHACHSQPCRNGGTCLSHGTSYTCACHPHLTGRDCSVVVFASCDPNPCQNSGTCVLQTSGVKCTCSEGYTGDRCERTVGECGGSYTQDSGEIQMSLGKNGQQYILGPRNCNWRIEVAMDKVVSINFTRLDIHDSMPDCKTSFVEVIDPASGRFWKYCGSEGSLPKITSESNFVRAKFNTISTDHSSAFTFSWKAVTPRCGGEVDITTTTHAVMQSPGYPDNYPPNMDCMWKILASPSKHIQFLFYTIDIEPSDCSKDYLRIYNLMEEDYEENSPIVVAQYCNSTVPSPITSPFSAANLVFHSDSSGSGHGFRATVTVLDGCGGVLTKNSGNISPPMDEVGTYSSSQECEWRIQLPMGDRIKIVFNSFDLEIEPCDDFLEVRDGPNRNSPLVGKWCGSSLPPSYTSSDNTLTILFSSDYYLSGEGFTIHYENVCGGEFTGLSGEIRSPNYPLAYPNEHQCVYVISVPPGKNIELEFQDFDIEDFTGRFGDYVEIFDGDSRNSSSIGIYHGTDTPSKIISSSNYLYIVFISDLDRRHRGFLANYSTFDVPCGGILKQTTAVFSSPQTDDGYLPNVRCVWVISAPPGHVIELHWNSFHLEYSHECYADAVEIYENSTSSNEGYFIEKYCGLIIPPTISSSTNIMMVVFRSNGWVHRDGFTAHYVMIDKSRSCGGRFRTPTGVIESPNFPNKYPNNKECIWIIQAPGNQQIRLTFENFTLAGTSGKCTTDNLNIRNGIHPTSPYISEFCGTDLPHPITSLTNGLRLHFTTDKRETFSGFRITWDTAVTGCGGTLSSQKGMIISPNYPEPYFHNAVCFFNIITARGTRIHLTIVDLDLEANTRCFKDYIQIYDGPNNKHKSLGRFCSRGAHPHSVMSTGNQMSIRFRSDSSYAGRGFHLEYVTDCNFTLSSHHGVLESPGYPNSYLPNTNCTWLLQAPMGNRFNISFATFSLQSTNSTDYVKILEGTSDQTPSVDLGTFFGENVPRMVSSTLDQVYIHFVADQEVQLSGFHLEWVVSGCGGVFREKPSGNFTSPNYPHNYTPNIICEWQIIAPLGKSIQITIHDLDLEDGYQCYSESISIYGGEDDTAPVLLQACHQQTSSLTITTSGNHAFVRFKSGYGVGGKGFSASYGLVDSKCGGYFKSSYGEIHSHNYPQNYDKNDDCEWLIEAPPSHLINLTFVDFDVEPSRGNTTNFVNVYDGPTINDSLLLTHSGNTLPLPAFVFSTNNSLLVRHKSDGYGSAKGFRATYAIGCGGLVSAKGAGVIQMSDLHLASNPWKEPMWLTNCTWHIVAENPADKVKLTFNYLDMIRQKDEEFQEGFSPYIIVYDGDDSNSSVLAKVNSNKAPPLLQSSGSTLTIVLAFPGILHPLLGQFSAIYSTLSTACGGELKSEHGSIASPNFPDGYPSNADCVWELKTSVGNRVTLTFTSFDLEESEFCNFDYVEVRSDASNGTLQGVFCGSNLPTNITAARALWLRFHTNGFGTAKGFAAEYSFLHGNDLVGEHGEIASPLYPRKLIQEDIYKWTITVPNNKVVRITFLDFDIDRLMFDFCHQYLEIFDGIDETFPSLMKDCGFVLPSPVVSTSNVVMVVFSANAYVYRGSYFLLSWEATYRISLTSSNSTESLGCGQLIRFGTEGANSTTFTSPGFPITYPSAQSCSWIITTVPGFHLELKFNTVDLNIYNSYCATDYLRVYSGNIYSENSPTEVSEWKSISNSICLPNDTKLSFASDSSMKVELKIIESRKSKAGFSATVKSVCGGILTGPNGVINVTSCVPKYFKPANYSWEVRVRSGRTIMFLFEEFSLGSTQPSCSSSYIEFRNGGHNDSPILGDGKYCGIINPILLKSTTNRVYIKYWSTNHMDKGVVLRYKEVNVACEYNIRLDDKVQNATINSPDYPQSPSTPHISCLWIISAPVGERIQIDYVGRFDLKSSPKCDIEYIEVRDGATEVSPLIGHHCTEAPSSEATEDNHMYIKYFTDTDSPNNGFKAVVKIGSCGGTFYNPSNLVLNSPGYPADYLPGLDCMWKLVHHGSMSFTRFSFNITEPNWGTEDNCSEDYLEFIADDPFNKNGTDLVTKTWLCGKLANTTKKLEGMSNEMHIHFHSSSETSKTSLRRRRFSITINSESIYLLGQLNAESGVITSPGYPSPAPRTNYFACGWIITVPEGRRITVNIVDFDLEQSVATMYTWMKNKLIFSEGREFEYEIESWMTETVNYSRQVESFSNKMSIYYFVNSISGAHRGFKLEFSSNKPRACGGNLEASGSFFYSTLDKNISIFHCVWTRSADVLLGNQSTFTMVLNSSLQHNASFTDCSVTDETIIVNTEDRLDSNTLAKVCEDTKEPLFIRSPYLKTVIKVLPEDVNITNILQAFKDHPYYKLLAPVQAKANFSVVYKTQPCGGIINGPEAIITSPGYPGKYPANFDCAWLVVFESGTRIHVKFEALELEGDCKHDFVRLYNGDTVASPHLTPTLCGNNPQADVKTQKHVMFIEFHSDGSEEHSGFKISLTQDSTGCGGVLHSANGILQSPNYGTGDYPNNTECEWTVILTPGFHAELSFLGRFSLEQSTDCRNDFVKIFDYRNNSWELVGDTRCGRITPTNITTTSHQFRVLFRTNSEVTSDGFQVSWTSMCGSAIEVTGYGSIMSPNYPRSYPSDSNCNYTLLAKDKPIYVKFEDFSMETGYGERCSYDYLAISTVDKGYSWKPNKLNDYVKLRNQTVCGFESPEPFYGLSRIEIIFKSDQSNSNRGFLLNYHVDSCGGNVTFPMIIEISFIKRIGHHNCTWYITAPADKVVKLKVLQPPKILSNCRPENVTVYNGHDITNKSSLLNEVCSTITKTLYSSGNKMAIQYNYDGGVNPLWLFKAAIIFTYGEKVGCGGTRFIDSPITLKAPDIDRDGKYEPFLSCSWLFLAPASHQFRVTFTKLDIQNCSQSIDLCSCDALEIHDGDSESSPVIGMYCGTAAYPEVTSSGGSLLVTFTSDGTQQQTGFELVINPTLSPCGQVLRNVTTEPQVLTSPGYPGKYPNNMHCFWHLVRPPNRYIQLRFTDLDMEAANCTHDYVQITRDTGRSYLQLTSRMKLNPLIRKVCGTTKSEYLIENNAQIRFVSDGSTTGRGFKLEYYLKGCDTNYTDPSGRILVMNSFPRPLGPNSDNSKTCQSLIKVPQANMSIALYFNSFRCSKIIERLRNVKMTVYDGTSAQAAERTPPLKNLVYDGTSAQATELASLCTIARPSPIFSTGPALLITFENFYDYASVDATYTSTDQGRGCGGQIQDFSGSFTSPLYPLTYKKDSVCRWDITVPHGNRIYFRFAYFDIGSLILCTTNYIEFYDVDPTTGNESFHSRYCGKDQPAPIQMNGERAFVRYVTSVHNNGTGWELSFMSKP